MDAELNGYANQEVNELGKTLSAALNPLAAEAGPPSASG